MHLMHSKIPFQHADHSRMADSISIGVTYKEDPDHDKMGSQHTRDPDHDKMGSHHTRETDTH